MTVDDFHLKKRKERNQTPRLVFVNRRGKSVVYAYMLCNDGVRPCTANRIDRGDNSTGRALLVLQEVKIYRFVSIRKKQKIEKFKNAYMISKPGLNTRLAEDVITREAHRRYHNLVTD